MKFKKSMLISLAVIMIALSACSNKSKDAASSSSPGDQSSPIASATPPASEPVAVADPFGKYEQPTVITIGKQVDPTDKSLPAGDTPGDNWYTRNIKEKLNIDIKLDWQAAGADYDQKVNLSIASNTLPDALSVNEQQLRRMVKSGMLEDLTGVYNEYTSPLTKSILDLTDGKALKTSTFDGKLYGIPNTSAQADGVHTMWIRKDWLDKLGLEVPKTLDDIEKVARAFVDQDPDGNGKKDTIGISGPQGGGNLYATFLASTNNSFGFDPIFSSFHSYPGYWVKGTDGQPVYGSTLPETKTALAKLRDLYAKGLIDHEMGIRKDSTEPIVSGKTGIFFGMWWFGYYPLPDALKNDPNANWQNYTVPLDADGKFNAHMPSVSNHWLVVRKGYEHPEAIVKMQNLFDRDETSFPADRPSTSNYPIMVIHAALDAVEYSTQGVIDLLAGKKTIEEIVRPTDALLKADLENIKKVKLEPFDKYDIGTWNPSLDGAAFQRSYSLLAGVPYYKGDYNKVYSLTYGLTKTMESRWTNLKKLEDETFLKIILGAAPIDDFDKFVKDWKSQGGDTITQEVAEVANS
ncbi:unnamed protein product [Aphanomyces euteiches]